MTLDSVIQHSTDNDDFPCIDRPLSSKSGITDSRTQRHKAVIRLSCAANWKVVRIVAIADIGKCPQILEIGLHQPGAIQ
jgi:hypothetical protein